MGANWLREVKNSPGLQAWRFDGKSEEISVVPKGNLGVFRSDDCYVLVSLPTEGDLPNYLVLYWVGSSTKIAANTEKKVGDLVEKLKEASSTLSLKTEIQGKESPEFHELFLFRGGPMYIDPIVLKKQSNLRDDTFSKALYQIKGKKFARVKRVEIGHSSLNSGDVFILDCDQKIYQWTGKKANRMEKGRALDLGKRLRDERMNRCKAEIILEEEGRESHDFWNEMGGKGSINTVDQGGNDEEFEMASISEEILYRVGLDGQKQITIDKVERADILHRGLLEHESSYVLDCINEIFVWHGSKTTGTIRQEAALYAEGLQRDGTRPGWVSVTITANGAEPGLFKVKWKGLFEEYVDTPDKFKDRLNHMNPVAKVRQERINVDALLHPEKYAAAKEEEIGNERLVGNKDPADDSETKIFYIKRKALVDLPQDEHGTFYSENCYVMHYMVNIPGSVTRHLIYFWQGRSSSVNSRGYSAMLAAELAKNLSKDAIQIRVVQNKEPEHFLSHFTGKYCVRQGKRHGWKKRQTHPVLYQIRGAAPWEVRSIQVRNHCSSLSSSDVYVIHKRRGKVCVWYGSGCNEDERAFATAWYKQIAESDPVEEAEGGGIPTLEVEEGKESAEFWELIPGGAGDYCRTANLVKHPRLFICSDRSSVFKVHECIGFSQEDLNERSVAFMDCKQEVFIWIGTEATVRERKMATQTALDYILEDGRNPENCHLFVTNSGAESYHFTAYFQGWDHAVSVDDLLEALANEAASPRVVTAPPVRVQHEGGLRRQLSRKQSSKAKVGRQQSINKKSGQLGRQQSSRTKGLGRQVSTKNKNHSKIATPSAEAALDANAEQTEITDGQTLDGIRGTRTKTLARNTSVMLVQVEFTKRTRNISKWNPAGLVYDFDRLKVKPSPADVDGAHLEAFLSVEEFWEIFGTTIDAFYALPVWKQLVIKKDKSMF